MNKTLVLLCNAERLFRPTGASYVCVKGINVYMDDAQFNELKVLRGKRANQNYPDQVKIYCKTHDVVDFVGDDGRQVKWLTSGESC